MGVLLESRREERGSHSHHRREERGSHSHHRAGEKREALTLTTGQSERRHVITEIVLNKMEIISSELDKTSNDKRKLVLISPKTETSRF